MIKGFHGARIQIIELTCRVCNRTSTVLTPESHVWTDAPCEGCGARGLTREKKGVFLTPDGTTFEAAGGLDGVVQKEKS